MGETVVIRGLAAGAAVAAVVGSVLMRRWDRSAGKQVAQLTAARARDEWKTDERLAELETDLEETRQARARLETKLRGKRAELARLRTEHADLLRRYATAEAERASALEGRRLLETERSTGEAAANDDEKAGVPKAARALETAMQARSLVRARSDGRVGEREYRRAADALRDLARNGAVQREAEERASASASASASVVSAPAVPAPAVAAPAVPAPAVPAPAVSEPAAPAASAAPVPAAPVPAEGGAALAVRDARPAMPVRRPAPPVRRATGGFDFFGTQHQAKQAAAAAKSAVEEQDLADVVGEEALAAGRGADERVIDLTAHDETEQIDVVELRDAI
ncbi:MULTISPECIES: coiled-coil domain-containing protein [Streptomyces]|uniref:hypothetical protein n=1 Tax=Streptomyces TaxID=1883 RepID=UPI0028BD42C5|nr:MULTISPECIES: hypothetical protein [Streptomyces]